EEKLVPVEITKASTADLTHTLSATGEIIAAADVNVMPKVTGRVEKVLVKVGDKVRQGQALLQLEGNETRHALEQAEAGLELAQANWERARQALKDAEINFERSKILYDAQAIAKSQLEQAESALVTAQSNLKVAAAQLKQAQATLHTTQDNYNNASLTSPIDGVVAGIHVDPGDTVTPQAPAVTVVQLANPKVKVYVSENVVSSVKLGATVPVAINALHKTVNGTVLSVAPRADAATRAFAVEIQLPNEQGEIKPGMVARLNLSTGTSAGVLALPVDAVLEREGRYYVFIVEDGKAKEISVQVGVTSGDLVEIKNGLKIGQTVIVKGNRLVADGQKVKVVKELGGAAR
ncbi:MAG: efflux RND transporter periplasmic adaptor subunit, partial [Firmicutes bacterium]|nr:efflux RND transporter periplasmic adaptor subunit [Bacillota bacterium]